MTSMRSVATAGSVSGSRLVTQNLLLGLDSGWMTGLWTVRAQRQGALRPGGEEHCGAGEGPGRGVGSASSCSGEAGCRPCKTWPIASPASSPTPRPLGLCTCHTACLERPSQPSPPGLAPTCAPSFSLRVTASGRPGLIAWTGSEVVSGHCWLHPHPLPWLDLGNRV